MLGGQRENALFPGCACFGGRAQGAWDYVGYKVMNEREEMQFGNRVRQVLNQGTTVRPNIAKRLEQARARALERQRAEPALAWADNVVGRVGGWGGFALRVLLPLAMLLGGAAAIYTWQQNQRDVELEEIDSQLLTDDLPIDAYLDRGFQNWLKKRAAEE
jgi:Protein of unknown function (DUF3619)